MSGEPQRPKAPTLVKFRRTVEGDKPAVIRWTYDNYDGKPFVNARIWTIGARDVEYPTKHGITVRSGEIDAVIDALCKARDRMRGGHDAGR